MSVNALQKRTGRAFDTLTGHSFGTSKRYNTKRNFDEIDNAGFNDFSKRNFDEIDNAGFNDFSKRNFDEIDNAGFNDFSKRNFDEIDNAGFKDYLRKRNFDEIDAAGFNDFSKRARAAVLRQESPLALHKPKGGDLKEKRNFDEIDAAGFNDFSKRNDEEPFLFSDYNDIPDLHSIHAFLYALRHRMPDDLLFYDPFKNYEEDTPDLVSKRGELGDYPPVYPNEKVAKYDEMPPNYSQYYGRKPGDYPPYYPSYDHPYNDAYDDSYRTPYYPPYYSSVTSDKMYTPLYYRFLQKVINNYKQKYGGDVITDSATRQDEPTFYRGSDSKRGDSKHRKDHQTTDSKTHL